MLPSRCLRGCLLRFHSQAQQQQKLNNNDHNTNALKIETRIMPNRDNGRDFASVFNDLKRESTAPACVLTCMVWWGVLPSLYPGAAAKVWLQYFVVALKTNAL